MAEGAFEAGRLRLARDLRALSQAKLAHGARLTSAAVSQFESGAPRPADETRDRLAQVLNVPSGFFELPLIETHEGFFRSLRRTTVTDRRRARAIAHVAHDMVAHASAGEPFPSVSVPSFPIASLETGPDEIEAIALKVRQIWGIPLGPAPNIVDLLETHGVIVIRLPLDSADVDAFSLPFIDRPVVVLGSDKNDRARSRFDAAHELGHLIIHGEQFWGLPEVEKQAHQFAAAFLMPREAIHTELPRHVDWPTLFELKRKWQVSLAALLLRAKTLGRMSEATYLTAVKAASARGWRRVEPVPLGETEMPKALPRLLRSQSGAELRASLPGDALDAIAATMN